MPTGKVTEPTPFSRITPAAEMSLAQLLDERLRGLKLDFNCHAIAKIQTFNSANLTCTASINYTKTFLKRNEDGTYSDEYIEYPVLADVPVVVMSGGAGSLTFPIAAGDDCLILFNDRDIDNWFATGQALPLNSNRLHSLNDGIALVGIRSSNNPIAGYDSTRVVLKNNQASVGVGANKIQIKNQTRNLYTILNNLITALQTFAQTTSTATTAPQIATAALTLVAAIKTVPNDLSAQLGELME